MDSKEVNIDVIKQVALGLQELRQNMVFVGGATLSLYTDDPAADAVRPTKDIDLSISLTGYGAWNKLQERLQELRFYPDAQSKVLCRFYYESITIDIMPDDPNILGFTNPWYRPGLDQSIQIALTPELSIRILPVVYFLATKFSAYHSRGGDPRTSHDFEDIVYVTDHRLHLVEEIKNAHSEVRDYLKQEYLEIWNSHYREEIIGCHLMEDTRLPLIEDKLEKIIKL